MRSNLSFPPRVALANLPTPFHPLDRLSARLGGPRIWIKRDDMTGIDLTGNKIRKLEFSLGAALAKRCDTLITCGSVQSNHCRTTAAAGARLGLKVHLVLLGRPTDDPDGNHFLDQLFGAEITYLDSDDFGVLLREMEAVEEECLARGRKPYIVPLGLETIDALGVWGYILACDELKTDFDRCGISAPVLVTAVGTGSTVAGLLLGNQLYGLGMRVQGVNVLADAAFFVKRVSDAINLWHQSNEDLVESLPSVEIHDGYVSPGYGQAGPPIFELIRMLAGSEGIALDPVYSAKAFAALVDQVRQGFFDDSSDVVFLHTGGMFGLMAQRRSLGGRPATAPVYS
jgi:D-cysteine desulfhydrase